MSANPSVDTTSGKLEEAGTLHDACLLPAERRGALVFCPYDDIALVMDEFEGRLTVVMANGDVVHRPGPLASVTIPGLHQISAGVLASPRHARARADKLWFPDGWTFPRVKLPQRTAPMAPRVTMIKVVGSQTVEIARIRELSGGADGWSVVLDNGTAIAIRHQAAVTLGKRLGLPSVTSLAPASEKHRHMYRLGLRDFPYVLLEASVAALRRAFGGDTRKCIANLIWEAARHRARGTPLDYGTEYRGFYYRPIRAVLNRLKPRITMSQLTAMDLLEDVALDEIDRIGLLFFQRFNDPMFTLYGEVLSEMIGDARLITLSDIGFVETRPELRMLGKENADWLIVTEKASLLPDVRRLSEEFHASFVVLGGMARWEAAEPTAKMLSGVLAGRTVRIVTYVDYDPAGWEIVEVFVRMLERYGVKAEIVGRLVLPKRFTSKELQLVAEPVPLGGSNAAKAQRWMKETRGVNGKALGVHGDHLRPYERVRQAFIEETALTPFP